MSYRIGVLALQGNFQEHISIFQKLGTVAIEVRYPSQLDTVDALVIPGGESTTIAKLETTTLDFANERIGIFEAIKNKIHSGIPVWGTCMGSIILAKHIEGSGQGRIGIFDVTVRRNAFGPQKFSTIQPLAIPVLGSEFFPGVFIRAPLFIKAGKNVEVLSYYKDGFVMARQNKLLITAFHPEMTDDLRVHQYFLTMLS